ncbi:uncharacterized protein N7473_001696 [Penicillium subrubescens]|uniref:Uncharacterized protein n=1 Tax=Penicillium subrubescens TaxID=1316194 RepID=A0A1Q5TBW1_9EURO|nr:uncharacterized protein N7473_001696 [Penicillium subrubescens]KAJ5904780.1 hypothetical protein N7473_001696 [Penicillium subrubescens]OKO97718.1 hypothetical protein PENSUB_9898 [Penicillium subrubescens]
MASQAPSTPSDSHSERPSTTGNLQGGLTVDTRSDDDMSHAAPPSHIPPTEMVTCLECLTWIAGGRRPAEICSISSCAMEQDLNIPYFQCTRCVRKHHICHQVRSARLRGLLRMLELLWAQRSHLMRRVDYARQIWEIYQQLDPAEKKFWDLLNEGDSSDEEHPEYSEENPNGES